MRFFAIITALLFGISAFAEGPSDPAFEAGLRQEKRDFEKYLDARGKSSADETKAAEVLRKTREAYQARQIAALNAYRAKMKRYSMEEVEARDRADEQRIEKENQKFEKQRTEFVATRDRRRQIEARVGTVDVYRAYDIDMTHEPESKNSHAESASGAGSSSGGGGFE